MNIVTISSILFTGVTCCSNIYNHLKQHQRLIPVLHNLLPSQALEYYEYLLNVNSSPFVESPTQNSDSSDDVSINNSTNNNTLISPKSTAVCFTVSLRHNLALETIQELKKIEKLKNPINMRNMNNQAIPSLYSSRSPQSQRYLNLLLGSSTVKTFEEVKTLKSLNIDFISTISWNENVTKAANLFKIPLLCGVNCISDVSQALNMYDTNIHTDDKQQSAQLTVKFNNYVHGLKFYPGYEIKPIVLKSLLKEIGNSILDNAYINNNNMKSDSSNIQRSDGVIILIAGSVTPYMIRDYQDAGASHFCIGFDCQKKSVEQICNEIKAFNNVIYR